MYTLQYVQAYAAQLVNIWMVDLCKETNFWWCHRIVVREEELKFEDTSCSNQLS